MKEKFLKRLAAVLGVSYKNVSDAYHLVEKEFDDAVVAEQKKAEKHSDLTDEEIGEPTAEGSDLTNEEITELGSNVSDEDLNEYREGQEDTEAN